MSVSIHEAKTSSEPLAVLSEKDIAALNAAAEKHGLGFTLDPYGDVKLLDAHIERVVALPEDAISSSTRRVFEALKGREVVYVQGD